MITGRLPARGGGVLGGAVISWVGDRLAVAVLAAIVATGKLWVGDAAAGDGLLGLEVLQPAATNSMAMAAAAPSIRRRRRASVVFRFSWARPVEDISGQAR